MIARIRETRVLVRDSEAAWGVRLSLVQRLRVYLFLRRVEQVVKRLDNEVAAESGEDER